MSKYLRSVTHEVVARSAWCFRTRLHGSPTDKCFEPFDRPDTALDPAAF